VLAYRERQAKQWQRESAEEIAGGILKHTRLKYMRFSEAGDFPEQRDVEKMSRLAELLGHYGLRTYGYTARRDLNFTRVSKHMTVTGSGFGIHNRFDVVKKYNPDKFYNCPGNCRSCNFCKERRGITINVEKH
jgi:hypothetical protein